VRGGRRVGHAVTQPLVSVLINNYNYATFLGAAIDSALAQSYPSVEVIVVDDGSGDNSREVISSYGDEVVAIYKDNGGQASTFNAGFACSRGDIVTFLDADDVLNDRLVARVVEEFAQDPSVGMVQCRLELADASCAPLGLFIPPGYVHMPTADLRGRPADVINSAWWAPTSGISVASTVLKRVLPLPEEMFRISADIGLTRACALCAPVASLPEPGGYYRSHGGNYYNRGRIEIQKIRNDVTRYVQWQTYLREFADSVGVKGYPADPYKMRDTVLSIQRLLLARLDSAEAPVRNDTRVKVAWQGMRAALRRPDIGPLIKALLVCWFALMAVLPRSLAERVANKTLFQQNFRRSSMSTKSREAGRV
jgi:glycosyltransferase involved in cell wall biosynthesis